MRLAAAGIRSLLGLGALFGVACASLPRPSELPGIPAGSGVAPEALETAAPGTLPPPPGLRARSGELRAVPLQWKPILSEDVAGYLVERAAAGEEAFRPLARVEGRLTLHFVDRDPALRDATTYRYRVRSLGADGAVAAESSEAVEATTAALPAPPGELEAYSHLPRRVALQWEPSEDPDVAGYVVQRSPAADGPFLNVARLEGRFASSWVDEGLGDLRVFYYRLAAVNAAGGQGPPGEAVQAVTKAEPLPPVGLRVAERRLGENRLVWEPNVEEDVAGYRVLRQPEGAGEPRLVEVLPPHQTSCVDRSVEAGQTVTYRVVAFDADGLASDPSEAVEVRSEDYGLRAVPGAEGIALRWEPRAQEGYSAARVYRLGWLGRQELARVEGSRYLDTDVEPDRTYRYVVELERADGTRAPASKPVEATARLAPAPGGESAGDAAAGAGPGGAEVARPAADSSTGPAPSPAADPASSGGPPSQSGADLRSETGPLD